MEMVKTRSCLSLPEVRRYMIQLCGGVKYMHQRAVIHRDLKMGNLFLDARMNLKIGDFGLAAIVVSERERRQTLCGTPNYIAPEILDKKSSGGHDHKVDTWAVGIICYAMLTGGPPFASKTQPEIYAKLKQLEYSWKTDGLNYIPPQAKDLVVSCLNLTANARPEMDDLVEHEFFKMGSIAEEMSPHCRTSLPEWLQNTDPRGDRVTPGYGVAHEVICAACGVGKTFTGMTRPSVGLNATKSAITEVEVENKHGLAPVVPLPPGMIYRQFAAAKEDWTTARKYPITGAQVRSRKQGTNTNPMDLDDIASALQDLAPVPVSALPTRAPAQSFAAQQRQQAVSGRTINRRQAPRVEDVIPEVVPKIEPPTKADAAHEYLRQRPVRSTSGVSTRSISTREAVPSKPTLTKSSTISEGIGRTIRLQVKAGLDHVNKEVSRAGTLARSTSLRRVLRELPDTSSSTKSSSSPPNSSDSNDLNAPASLQNHKKEEKADSTRPTTKLQSVEVRKTKPRLFDPAENPSLLKSSGPREVLIGLQQFREHLSGNLPISSHISRMSQPHPLVEKWVDYTNRYGMAYILSDHTVGCLLSTSENRSRPVSCIVVRNGRSHYVQRSQRSSAREAQQYVPLSGSPVEFYEFQESGAIKKALCRPEYFEVDVDKFGERATAQLVEHRMHSAYAQEKLKDVILCDKFAKYMARSIDSDEMNLEAVASGTNKSSRWLKFPRFYQRIGNVGVWGFSSSSSSASASDSLSFQFNFPDHSKMVLHQGGALLDLYHLQPADAMELAEFGAIPRSALLRRGRMLNLNVGEVVRGDVLTTTDQLVLKYNEVREKLQWIREVMDIWIREGGLGNMGREDGQMHWKGLQESARAKLMWVSVGGEDMTGNNVAIRKAP